jgi:hypothetical protein
VSAHVCHAVGCQVRCKPEYLMCGRHWRMVPRRLQVKVWATYQPGQCNFDPAPSAEWLDAAMDAVDAVAAKEGRAGQTEGANDG